MLLPPAIIAVFTVLPAIQDKTTMVRQRSLSNSPTTDGQFFPSTPSMGSRRQTGIRYPRLWLVVFAVIFLFGSLAAVARRKAGRQASSSIRSLSSNPANRMQEVPVAIVSAMERRSSLERQPLVNMSLKESPAVLSAPARTSDMSSNEIENTLPPHIANATFGGLWRSFECRTFFSSVQPVRNQTSWMMMRGIYHGIMLASGKVVSASNIRSSVSSLLHETGFQVPFSVRQVEKKGRGVFAEASIPKGTLIYTSHHGGHVRFTRGIDFKKFVYSVPSEMACEVLQCAAVQSLKPGKARPEDAVITVDLDSGCYVNTHNLKEEPNAGCPPSGDRNCVDNDYALRDIKAGEEIIGDYSQFALPGGWKWFSM